VGAAGPGDAPRRKVSAGDVAVNTRRGGELRVLLSPGTVGATAGFLGVFTLPPGEGVTAHYHPYSEEFIYLVDGELVLWLDGQEIQVRGGDAVHVPKNVPHRLENRSDASAFAVFHSGPLAPTPAEGHVDIEPSGRSR
jgi:quercetin dioxygenase-like cupin family protein